MRGGGVWYASVNFGAFFAVGIRAAGSFDAGLYRLRMKAGRQQEVLDTLGVFLVSTRVPWDGGADLFGGWLCLKDEMILVVVDEVTKEKDDVQQPTE